MQYQKYFNTRRTSQQERIPGTNQVMNSAGGYAWQIDDWQRLQRFSIIGSEGGTYYIGEGTLTKENAEACLRCLQEDPIRFLNTIVEISESGRAHKNDPALFLLAMACSDLNQDPQAKQLALDSIPRVARIGTHLFTFAGYIEAFRGWGRGLRSAIGNWYLNRDVKNLAHQAVKYQQRGGWSHRDLLRLAHPEPDCDERNALFGWITQKRTDPAFYGENLGIVNAFIQAQKAEGLDDILDAIDGGLPREGIPTEWLKEPRVWQAMLDKGMPIMAMIRNLGNMTKTGAIKPMDKYANMVAEQLRNEEAIKRSRIHPMHILLAMKTYASGEGFRGGGQWHPINTIIDALDDAFYLSFQNVEPTGQRHLLAVDVSSSMSASISGTNISVCEAAAAMAMTIMRSGDQYLAMGFAGEFRELPLTPKQRLDDVLRHTRDQNFGRTDCALPMLWALKNQIPIDVFVVLTDSETWAAGHDHPCHPSQALGAYRQKMGIPAKLVVAGMTSNGFSIADPNDAGMLDLVGFDAALPTLVADFAKGVI